MRLILYALSLGIFAQVVIRNKILDIKNVFFPLLLTCANFKAETSYKL